MRIAWLGLVATAACSSEPRQDHFGVPDAAVTSADAAVWFETRSPTAVILGPHRVLWTQAHGACSLDLGCGEEDVGPTLSVRDLSSGPVTTLIEDRWGATSLAGDEDEVFLLLADTDPESTFVARYRPAISTTQDPMTAPRPGTTGLAVDATYVYWAVPGAAGATNVYRARRDGDGTDATIIQPEGFAPRFALDGYLWSGSYRIPTAGGAVEHVAAIDESYPATTGTGMFAARELDAAGTYWSVGILDAAGAYQVVFSSIFQPYRPSTLVFDSNEVLWTSWSGALYRAHLDDPTFAPDPRNPTSVGVFAVTGDAILYNFTRRGYDLISR